MSLMLVDRKFVFKDVEALKAVVADRLELDPQSLQAVLLAPDEYGEVWKLVTPDQAYIARLCALPLKSMGFSARRFLQGVALESLRLRFVRENTDIPVPKVYLFEPHCSELNCSLTLTENLPGGHIQDRSTENRVHLRDIYTRALGRAVREIHALHFAQFGQEGDPVGLHNCWADTFETLWRGFAEEFCADVSMLQGFLDAYSRLRPFFEEVPVPSLLHGNLHRSNFLLLENGKLTGMIDWVDSIWGDPLLDLAHLRASGVLSVSFFLEYPEAKELIDTREGFVRSCVYEEFFSLERILQRPMFDSDRRRAFDLVTRRLARIQA